MPQAPKLMISSPKRILTTQDAARPRIACNISQIPCRFGPARPGSARGRAQYRQRDPCRKRQSRSLSSRARDQTSGGTVAPVRKLIAGNWKMNGTRDDAQRFAAALGRHLGGTPPPCDMLLCPPATLVGPLHAGLAGSPVMVGGQDCHAAVKGAHTGDIAAAMFADLGCSHVIVGHSERRAAHGETDPIVAAKAAAERAAALVPIICIGETASH